MKISSKDTSTSLPRLMLISERHLMTPSTLEALASALRGGARLIQLREKDLEHDEVLRLAQTFKQSCDAFGAKLIINSRLEIAREIGASLHLPENKAESITTARAILEVTNDGVLIGAAAHSLEAVVRAQDQGADYILFGSVFPTQSHPGSTPAGLEMLREVCAAVTTPVFAVGGITPQNARQCLEAGAHGIAVIRAVWSTPDVAAAVAAFNVALTTAT